MRGSCPVYFLFVSLRIKEWYLLTLSRSSPLFSFPLGEEASEEFATSSFAMKSRIEAGSLFQDDLFSCVEKVIFFLSFSSGNSPLLFFALKMV